MDVTPKQQKLSSKALLAPVFKPIAIAGASDPLSSHLAANDVNELNLGEHNREAIISYVISQGTQGANSWEIMQATGISWHDVGREVIKCIRSGHLKRVLEDDGKTELHRHSPTPRKPTGRLLVLCFDARLDNAAINPQMSLELE